MAVTLKLQPEYGYVMLVFVLSIFQLTWMAFKVGAARKKYDVKVCFIYLLTYSYLILVSIMYRCGEVTYSFVLLQYPAVYSDKSNMFNCVQRVHQNT